MDGPQQTLSPDIAGIDPLLPPQVAAKTEAIGVAKARMPFLSTFVLAVLAGAFIALGADFFTVVTTDSGLGYGTTRLIGGVAFSLGLLLVVIGGAELFTGNNLIAMAWASGRISAFEMLRNWVIVYVGNFAGAIATAAIVYESGQWKFADYGVGANAVRIAQHKTDLAFGEAVALGVLCNALVCLAVWLTYSARSNIDKAIAVVFPITAFVASGFEHSVANMYFIPLGLLVKREGGVTAVDSVAGLDFSNLTWADFFARNLLPVTLGNIAGGALMVGAVYWFVYLRRQRGPS